MGKITSSYKKAFYEELLDNVKSNTSHYYAFASNPYTTDTSAQPIVTNDYSVNFVNDWQMIFGKKITSGDIAPVIAKKTWTSGTVYDRYDNRLTSLHDSANFYVVSNPTYFGGSHHIYKCIDNNNGSPSTVDPGSIGTPTQPTTFQTSPDNYKWRYIASISAASYDKFASDNYIPIVANSTIVDSAPDYAGVEVVVVANGGVGYETYANGFIQSVSNTTLLQIETTASGSPQYYKNNGIYLYNNISSTSQLFEVTSYVSNTSGKWVYLSTEANIDNIIPGSTKYYISPKVVFETDGVSPQAYSIVNTYTNSISDVVILDIGSNITWANVSIQSNTNYGYGSNLYAIVPPPGGHGRDPVSGLDIKGIAVAFTFNNSEFSTVPTEVSYNKIGILRNPFAMSNAAKTSTRYYTDTFNQVIVANVNPSYVFSTGDVVTGETSKAKAVVAHSNSTQVFLVGDKYFQNGEGLKDASNNHVVDSISIKHNPDIYTKDTIPLYVQNINKVTRSNTQSESFRLIIQI